MSTAAKPPKRPKKVTNPQQRRQGRNIAMLLTLLGLSLIFYGLTIVKMTAIH